MLRLVFLLFFMTIVAAQVPRQTAYIRLQTTPNADLRGTLTVPSPDAPAELPAAFAQALGCGLPALQESIPSRVVMQCPAGHPSVLTFTHVVRFDVLARVLRKAGVEQVELTLTGARFGFLRLAPDIPPHKQYAIDELPSHLLIDGGFETDRVGALVAFTVMLMLTPLLLGLLRPSNPLYRRAQIEAIFVFGWISWIWVLLRAQAGALLAYLFGAWSVGPLLFLLVPPLVAVWIGSRMASVPKESDASRYRHVRFWTGAAFTCLASTLVNILLAAFNAGPSSILIGFVLAAACVLRLRSLARGGSRSLSKGDLRKRAFELASTAGVTLRGVSLLTAPTPRPIAFAARWGIIFLNEGLLRLLSRREVDAVLGHELSHLGPRRSARAPQYVMVVIAAFASMWIANLADVIPVLLLTAYFSFKLWRRKGEYTADRNSVRWVGDPEALITGIARVSYSHGMPLDWGAPISWMMAHPPTMGRIRAIALAGGITNARLEELLQESRIETTDHYQETQAPAIAKDAA
jgi:Zn-dependent protease with chaperone function